MPVLAERADESRGSLPLTLPSRRPLQGLRKVPSLSSAHENPRGEEDRLAQLNSHKVPATSRPTGVCASPAHLPEVLITFRLWEGRDASEGQGGGRGAGERRGGGGGGAGGAGEDGREASHFLFLPLVLNSIAISSSLLLLSLSLFPSWTHIRTHVTTHAPHDGHSSTHACKNAHMRYPACNFVTVISI